MVVVFDFDLEIVLRQHTLTECQDLGHLASMQPVCRVVVAYPELQDATLRLPDCASAVDEVLCDVPDLCQMEMGRDLIAVRQIKPGKFPWLRLQSRLQFA